MQENRHLYEYAIIRYIPKVERGEFINVGVITFCKQKRFIDLHWHMDTARIQCFFPNAPLELIQKQLESFQQIAAGAKSRSPIAALDAPSRFRWLTASRSNIMQLSPIHIGYCDDLQLITNQLMEEYVFLREEE